MDNVNELRFLKRAGAEVMQRLRENGPASTELHNLSLSGSIQP
jgi:hypothetical protein